MDTLMLRCSMSPAFREQQGEFNVITTADGKMLVGQFGSLITHFLEAWKGSIAEGDVFIPNDTYLTKGAVMHLNDVIILLPIFHDHRLIGWASQFGHLTDVGGMVLEAHRSTRPPYSTTGCKSHASSSLLRES